MSETNNRVSRKWLYIPWIIAALLVIAYSVGWAFAAREMKKAVGVWVADQRTAGMTVEHGEINAKGFPFFLKVEIDAPDIAQQNQWRWRAEQLSLHALPYDLSRLIFAPHGEQITSYAGAGEWLITGDDVRASIANDKAHGWKFATTLRGASAFRAEDGAIINVEALTLDLAPEIDDITRLTLNVAMSDFAVADQENSVGLSKFQAVFTLSQTHMLQGPDAAAQWRSAGGTLFIKHFLAASDEASFNAKGRLYLDADDFVTGKIETEIINPAPFAQMLGRTDLVTTDDAEAIATGLTLLALTSGGKITAPIDLAHGKASIGGVELGALPQVK